MADGGGTPEYQLENFLMRGMQKTQIMNKKQLIVAWMMGILLLSGCAAGPHLEHFRRDVERTHKVEERVFDYSIKDVFLAIVQVLNDTGTVIYEKDYDNKIILGMSENSGFSTGFYLRPSHNFGFWLIDLGNNKTKVILKMVAVEWLMQGTAEEEFNLIKRELEMRTKLKNE